MGRIDMCMHALDATGWTDYTREEALAHCRQHVDCLVNENDIRLALARMAFLRQVVVNGRFVTRLA